MLWGLEHVAALNMHVKQLSLFLQANSPQCKFLMLLASVISSQNPVSARNVNDCDRHCFPAMKTMIDIKKKRCQKPLGFLSCSKTTAFFIFICRWNIFRGCNSKTKCKGFQEDRQKGSELVLVNWLIKLIKLIKSWLISPVLCYFLRWERITESMDTTKIDFESLDWLRYTNHSYWSMGHAPLLCLQNMQLQPE